MIEGWGTGIRRMIDACKEYGVEEPVFTEVGTDFRVEFFRKTVTSQVTDRVTETVTDKEKVLLVLLKENPAYTMPQLATKMGVSRKTIGEYTKSLKEKRIIERVGSDRKGYWAISDQ